MIEPIVMSPAMFKRFRERGWIDADGNLTKACEEALSDFVAEQFDRAHKTNTELASVDAAVAKATETLFVKG